VDKKALTLIESLIAVILIVVIFAALASLFVAGKRYIIHAHSRMAAGELGRVFLDPLQMQVRQDTWDSTCLGGSTCPPANQTINDINYNATYNTSNISGTDLRRVTVNILWQEPAP
jgi:type II secretory pathway pseudopilin PulG